MLLAVSEQENLRFHLVIICFLISVIALIPYCQKLFLQLYLVYSSLKQLLWPVHQPIRSLQSLYGPVPNAHQFYFSFRDFSQTTLNVKDNVNLVFGNRFPNAVSVSKYVYMSILNAV